MTWNDLIYGIGDLATETFKILPVLGNNFNWFIIVIGMVLMAIWLKMQADYNKEAKKNGTIM